MSMEPGWSAVMEVFSFSFSPAFLRAEPCHCPTERVSCARFAKPLCDARFLPRSIPEFPPSHGVRSMAISTDAPSRADRPLSLNMTLLSQHELDGFGGMGEGMSMQRAKDGRRILWLAHETGPKNFTGVDVSDPRNPKMVVQTELPGAKMRSNSLEVVGNTLAVAYQTSARGAKEAGFELFDVSTPEKPKSIAFYSLAGPSSRGVHQLWFADGEYIHCSSGAPD